MAPRSKLGIVAWRFTTCRRGVAEVVRRRTKAAVSPAAEVNTTAKREPRARLTK